MNILAIVNAERMEPPEAGTIGTVASAAGGSLTWRYRRLGDPVPETSDGFDGLVLFGGEMGVHELGIAPYVDRISRLTLAFHAAGKPVLGSCLGAQLIAHAFGAPVTPMGRYEHGFTRLGLTEAARADPLLATAEPVLHLFEMHQDTFALPDEAILLMTGAEVRNQGFRMGRTTYGFQCHFEVTADIIRLWHARVLASEPGFFGDAQDAVLARTEQAILAHEPQQVAFASELMRRWLALVAERAARDAP